MKEYKLSYEVGMNDFNNEKCDKYDCLIAVFAGVSAGFVDILFVGAPGISKAGKMTDQVMDKLVIKFAKMAGWKPRLEKTGSVASAIGFLERTFRVNYDQAKSIQVDSRFQLDTRNHHLKSLAHSPDIIGLFFSILNQFSGTSTFVSNGKIISIKNEGTNFELQGSTLVSKICCGFCNWIGHIMSDIAGSAGSRGGEKAGRGMGVPIPFMELFQLCNLGKLKGKSNETMTLARVMEQVFVEGYDSRFGIALAIPVLIEEFMIKVLWVIKKRFYEKREWKDVIPSTSHGDLRIMLLVGNGMLCIMDGGDALIRSKGGNALAFMLHINIVAWYRLIMLALREIKLRYGAKIAEAIYCDWKDWLSEGAIEYYQYIESINVRLDDAFQQFLAEQEQEYQQFLYQIKKLSFLNAGVDETVMISGELATNKGISAEEILNPDTSLESYFMELDNKSIEEYLK